MTTLAQRFARVLKRGDFVDRHRKSLEYKKRRRDATVATIPGWDARRERARAIKADVRANLEDYLEQWAARAEARGSTVHRAATAADANRIVLEIAQRHRATSIVKSKSMTTEECALNEFLHENGVVVTDTDLGERIVQMFGEPPSHLVSPAIHRSRAEIGELFARAGLCQPGEEDPTRLTLAARRALRSLFLEAEIGITGGNFLVAETGTLVVLENEANSILGTSLTDCHVAVVGIEKLIPRLADLGDFLTVLAPSSTGQRLTTYTTHYTGPQERTAAELALGMPDRELHVVLLDNGRRAMLGTPAEEALACIRCGACLNACPVFRRVGGHAYASVYMGPIGEILSPGLLGAQHASLPKASSLCGACNEVCPVKIDISGHIHSWRTRLRRERKIPSSVPPMLGKALARPKLWRAGLRGARALGPISSSLIRRSSALRRWESGGAREVPQLPEQSFRSWWRRRSVPGQDRIPKLPRGSGPRPAFAQSGSSESSRSKPEDLEEMFGRHLGEAGGEIVEPSALAELLAQGACATAAARAVLARMGHECALAPVGKADLDGVEVLFATASLRVARTGSCWVDLGEVEARAQLLLPEVVVLLVPRDRIVEDLEQLYDELDVSQLSSSLVHVCGPSKTADIESSLVYGAHGPKRLLVVPS